MPASRGRQGVALPGVVSLWAGLGRAEAGRGQGRRRRAESGGGGGGALHSSAAGSQDLTGTGQGRVAGRTGAAVPQGGLGSGAGGHEAATALGRARLARTRRWAPLCGPSATVLNQRKRPRGQFWPLPSRAPGTRPADGPEGAVRKGAGPAWGRLAILVLGSPPPPYCFSASPKPSAPEKLRNADVKVILVEEKVEAPGRGRWPCPAEGGDLPRAPARAARPQAPTRVQRTQVAGGAEHPTPPGSLLQGRTTTRETEGGGSCRNKPQSLWGQEHPCPSPGLQTRLQAPS